ncbi:MAG: Sec-independent protein translocase protein TatB [Pseudomonadota bacterium]
MLDLGWSELLVLGVAALIVVGPKDLPGMFRTVGQYVGKARGMAREFQRNMEDAARQTDLEDVRKAAQSVKDVGRMAAGGTAGLAQFGMDKTRKYAEDALKGGTETAASDAPAPAGDAKPVSIDKPATADSKPAAQGTPGEGA